ncbi:MAG: hypothetical protein EXR75_10860 [Myxococcales bacterium]|nr:hypothetical protein [Myxococcales bacterium]
MTQAEAEAVTCNLQCLIPSCQSLGDPNPTAQCAAGRCVAFSCDEKLVMCKSLPPVCPAGQTPLVIGTCWGGCVPVTECASVSACSKCGPANTCVTEIAKLGPVHHCVATPPACSGKPSCACMGNSVCIAPYSSCSESGAELSCSCPNC